MSIIRSTAGRALGIAALLVVGPLAMPAQAAPAPVAEVQAGTTIDWPVPEPRCQDKAPEGAVFVRRVQPPFGLSYEIYALPSGKTLTIYC